MINNQPVGKILATGDYSEVVKFWRAGEVAICFTAFVELKRLAPATLEKRRITRAKNRVLKTAPLFFDELFNREVDLIKEMKNGR